MNDKILEEWTEVRVVPNINSAMLSFNLNGVDEVIKRFPMNSLPMYVLVQVWKMHVVVVNALVSCDLEVREKFGALDPTVSGISAFDVVDFGKLVKVEFFDYKVYNKTFEAIKVGLNDSFNEVLGNNFHNVVVRDEFIDRLKQLNQR